MDSNVDWHLQTQNREYFDLFIRRLSLPVLIWVDQFTDLINKNLESANKKISGLMISVVTLGIFFEILIR